MHKTDTQDLPTRIRALADEAAASRDAYVVDVRVRGQQGSRVVEVFVDATDGVKLDELSRISRDLEFLLDTEDLVKGRYQLNVSSPGADRPLTEPRQYLKHVGRTLTVTTGTPEEGATRTGVLATVHDDRFELEIDGATVSIDLKDVLEARVQLPW
jgi:ribosome maturation factor RimP